MRADLRLWVRIRDVAAGLVRYSILALNAWSGIRAGRAVSGFD
ncbi:hypothetical protein BRPE64_ECDS00080 (plasmid) [Caballeronia insecticola]|uniref:Uncharacterized protein n=1 Tax=Caballeronia insecticola TaxID=758793 RepID=R4X4E2_9BURK|nr:hypothetical protein BRPE64_ECDS00080 [Caballeronia insecticola]